jgi:hypothetical protein
MRTAEREDTKVRRYEAVALRPPPPALRPAIREPENYKYKQRRNKCCLYLQFSDSLTREARGGGRLVSVRLAHWAPAGFLSRVPSFVSSFLRFFELTVGSFQFGSETTLNRISRVG